HMLMLTILRSSYSRPWPPPTTSTRSRSSGSGRRARPSSGSWEANPGSRTSLERDGVADERARHAVPAAAAAAQLGADDGDHLDACLSRQWVGVRVAVVGHHDAGRERHEVVAAVPLLPLRSVAVTARGNKAQLLEAERLGHHLDARSRLARDLD